MEKLVEMRDIHKRFDNVIALKGVDFDVYRGEVVGLVGDNGAGKSTLIKILTGVIPPDKGEIFFENKKVIFKSPRDARRIGIEAVYQEQALALSQTIARNIFMGREITNSLGILKMEKMNEECMRLLKEIGFLAISSPDIPVGNLSGGEKQGIAIARTLYFKAKLIVLDEPTSSLSIKEAGYVLDIIRQLKGKLSVVFITHNIYHVYPVADRFVILDRGEKIAEVKKENVTPEGLIQIMVKATKR